MNKKRLNRLKILIVVIIILLVYPASVFARYVYIVSKDAYLSSKKFYFESDYLKSTGADYNFDNWNGETVYIFGFSLYNFRNNMLKSDNDIEYTLKCTVSNEDVSYSFSKNESVLEKTGVIDHEVEMSSEAIYLKAQNELNVDDEVEINIEAIGTGEGEDGAKYSRKLTATITLTINKQSSSNFSIVDSTGDDYMTLILTNPGSDYLSMEVEFDPNYIFIDTNNKYYQQAKSDSNNIDTVLLNVDRTSITKDENGTFIATNTTIQSDFVSKIKFTIDPETTISVKMYKKDTNSNYTYPVVGNNVNDVNNVQSSNCIVNVLLL